MIENGYKNSWYRILFIESKGFSMKIRCRRNKFVPLFSTIANFTASRDVRPMLQNVKLVANETSLLLMATDGEVGARGELTETEAFVVDNPGEAILPAKLLRKIFAETTDEEIYIELQGSQITIKGAHFRYQLDTCDDADRFPLVPSFDETTYFKIPVNSFNRMVGRTVFATQNNNNHFELRGVKFIFSVDRITAVATDGRRLACQENASESFGDAQQENFTSQEAIFPPRTLNLIVRSDSEADDVLIAAHDADAIIKIGNIVVSTTLMTGLFPNWNAIIPDKTSKKRVDFIADEVARAIRQAEIVTTENKPGVWFKFSKGTFNITAAGEATGESSVELPIAYDGEPAELRLDSKFLNEFFREVPGEETVAFYFQQDYRTLFETSDGYRYVLMQLS